MKKIFLLLFVFSLIFTFNFSFAQSLFDSNTGLPSGIVEQISVDVVPEIPSPGDNVSIKTESYSSNFEAAYFTWKINGVTELEGYGQKNFNFVAPESGKTATINLTINKEEGGVITRTFTFSPADVDIIYEADTYTPPFYKGKSLFTSQADIRFVAMPNFTQNGVTLDPDKLIYKWSINKSVISDVSGYGKRVYSDTGGLIQKPFSVSVEVTAPNSSLKAKKTIYIETKEPEVVVYENNAKFGVLFEKAVYGEFLLQKPEIVLQAIPYFFSSPQKDSLFLDYTWKMNGSNITSGSETSSIRLRNESGEEGRSSVSLDIKHINNILQYAENSLGLNFSKNTNVSESNFEF